MRERQSLFDHEVDMWCRFSSQHRPRCRAWVEFSQRFAAVCEPWNGCWVAEEAVREWTRFMTTPEGEYFPYRYPEGFSFHATDPRNSEITLDIEPYSG